MFGREFISIILRNLSSIQPALRDVNRNSGRNPYPKISVKNYMSYKRERDKPRQGVVAILLAVTSAEAIG
jgi:hypothetical protein